MVHIQTSRCIYINIFFKESIRIRGTYSLPYRSHKVYMIAISPKFLETLKHSEDDSGRVDNVLRDDGKERVRDNIVSGKDNAVYRFPTPTPLSILSLCHSVHASAGTGHQPRERSPGES